MISFIRPILKLFILLSVVISCGEASEKPAIATEARQLGSGIEVIILGNVQDGGSPHIGCKKKCCAQLFTNPDKTRMVVSLGIIDHENNKTYVIDASPDFSRQIEILNNAAGHEVGRLPDGIFITHAHIGHYTGLMYLGREAKGAKNQLVYLMPKMADFISTNGPWSQLVELNNIKINTLQADTKTTLSSSLSITPFLVPHRDEFSETVGFKINSQDKSILFIPDIDKWDRWDRNIIEEIESTDFALLDATFYNSEEIPHRPMSEIPHPFVVESMELFNTLATAEKSKVHFIHLNHSNPLLNIESEASQVVRQNGFHVGRFNQLFSLNK